MKKSIYNKPPTTYHRQVEIVKERGLAVPNESNSPTLQFRKDVKSLNSTQI